MPSLSRRPRAVLAYTLSAVALAAAAGCASSEHADSTTSGAARQADARTASARIGELTIAGGYIRQPASPDVAAAYFTVTNNGPTADRLIKVATNVTAAVMPMTEAEHNGTGTMAELPKVVIPARGAFRFSPGHAHVMLEQLTRPLHVGNRVLMTLTFARAGTVTLALPVAAILGPATDAGMSGMPGMSGNS